MKPAMFLIAAALAGGPGPRDAVEPSAVDADTHSGSEADRSETRAAVARAVAMREPVVSCQDISGISPAPAEDLAWVVANVPAPPWAGVKAAECLVLHHADAAGPLFHAWVTDPELMGLGWVVLRHLDAMPQPLAVALARAAVDDGPDPAGARRRIRRSENVAVRAIGTE